MDTNIQCESVKYRVFNYDDMKKLKEEVVAVVEKLKVKYSIYGLTKKEENNIVEIGILFINPERKVLIEKTQESRTLFKNELQMINTLMYGKKQI